MPVLYLTTPGACLHRDHDFFVITVPQKKGAGKETVQKIPPHYLEHIVIWGHGHITAEALRYCFQKGIDVAWLSASGRFLGRSASAFSRSVYTRINQYEHFADTQKRLYLAQHFVRAKLHSACSTMKILYKNSGSSHDYKAVVEELERISRNISSASSVAELQGMEGAAAKEYFAALSATSKQLPFAGRNRRPPRDPVNALLSYGYAFLANVATSLLESRGLDVALGYLHSPRQGRPSLALDIMEEFRAPVVDRLVLRLCNLQSIRSEHFTQTPLGCFRLTDEGRNIFLTAWEKILLHPFRLEGKSADTVPQAIESQILRFVKHINNESVFCGFSERAAQ